MTEGGGWPTHAIGPFATHQMAEWYIAADKWRESWGSVSTDPRDLEIFEPDDDSIVLPQKDLFGRWRVFALDHDDGAGDRP